MPEQRGGEGQRGIFKDLFSLHLQKNKNKTNKELGLFRNYFWLLRYRGFISNHNAVQVVITL